MFDEAAADDTNFLDKYKISEYGTSMLIVDRFMVELMVYGVLAILRAVGTGKMGRLFGALHLLSSWALGFNLLFSCLLQILNYLSIAQGRSFWYINVNFWMTFAILLIVLLEKLYFIFFCIVGGEITDEEPKELDKSKASKNSEEGTNFDPKETESKLRKPIEKMVKKNNIKKPILEKKTEADKKKAINKKVFYLRRMEFQNLLPKSILRKSSMFSSNDPDKSKEYYLYHNNICGEIDRHYCNKSFYESFMARMYIVSCLIRALVLIAIIVFLDYDGSRVIQSLVNLLI